MLLAVGEGLAKGTVPGGGLPDAVWAQVLGFLAECDGAGRGLLTGAAPPVAVDGGPGGDGSGMDAYAAAAAGGGGGAAMASQLDVSAEARLLRRLFLALRDCT